jgi:hypothetical protein
VFRGIIQNVIFDVPHLQAAVIANFLKYNDNDNNKHKGMPTKKNTNIYSHLVLKKDQIVDECTL